MWLVDGVRPFFLLIVPPTLLQWEHKNAYLSLLTLCLEMHFFLEISIHACVGETEMQPLFLLNAGLLVILLSFLCPANDCDFCLNVWEYECRNLLMLCCFLLVFAVIRSPFVAPLQPEGGCHGHLSACASLYGG
eukprot:RCo045972